MRKLPDAASLSRAALAASGLVLALALGFAATAAIELADAVENLTGRLAAGPQVTSTEWTSRRGRELLGTSQAGEESPRELLVRHANTLETARIYAPDPEPPPDDAPPEGEDP